MSLEASVRASMHVACAADALFVPHCAAMLHSLCARHEPSRVHVHFLCDERLSRALLDTLAGFVNRMGARWTAHEVGPLQRARFPDEPRYGQVAWYRILLPELLPEQSRVLYIDADAIVADSLDELWATPLAGYALGAITDPIFPPVSAEFLSRLGLSDPREYFNSGLLLMNLEEWRRQRLTEALFDFIRHGVGLDSWPDQNALNAVMAKQRLPLAPRWNATNRVFEAAPAQLPYEVSESQAARQHPAIVHFVGPYKPWHYRCKHPLRELYFQHRRQTPWPQTRIEGRTLLHRLLRPLPVEFALRLELRLYRERARWQRWLAPGP